MKSLSVPTEEDWGDYKSDLDQKHAHRVFAGRTNQETQPFFRRNPIERTDELRWMPEVPFRYYMLGFRDFIMANEFEFLGASDAAKLFPWPCPRKTRQTAAVHCSNNAGTLPTIEHVARNQNLFEAKESIYGNFLEKLARIAFKPFTLLTAVLNC